MITREQIDAGLRLLFDDEVIAKVGAEPTPESPIRGGIILPGSTQQEREAAWLAALGRLHGQAALARALRLRAEGLARKGETDAAR